MRAKAIGALSFLPVTLLFATHPAMAGYNCVAKEIQGDPSARYDSVTATVMDDNRYKTHVERLINLGVLDPKRYSRRFFVINYWSTTDSPWNATNLGFNFPVQLKAPIRPLFAFLILNSGEYVERLVMDANGRDQLFGLKAQFSAGAPPPQLTVSFGLGTPDKSFLDALGKATLMAIELKYSDGETLTREAFNVSRSDIMQRTLDSALKMYNENREKCEYVPPQVEY